MENPSPVCQCAITAASNNRGEGRPASNVRASDAVQATWRLRGGVDRTHLTPPELSHHRSAPIPALPAAPHRPLRVPRPLQRDLLGAPPHRPTSEGPANVRCCAEPRPRSARWGAEADPNPSSSRRGFRDPSFRLEGLQPAGTPRQRPGQVAAGEYKNKKDTARAGGFDRVAATGEDLRL